MVARFKLYLMDRLDDALAFLERVDWDFVGAMSIVLGLIALGMCV